MSLQFHYNVYGCFRDPRADIELAKDAVEAGFEGIWIGDHFHPWIDSRPYTHHPWVWFGSLMSEIPDVPVGTSVTCPMLRYRPPLLAQAIATLDNMYPGRMHLGVGTGEALNEAHFVDGEWPDWGTRASMLVEALDVMQRLWQSEEYVSFDGTYFQYDGIKLYTPPKDEIDLHWAAWGPSSSGYAGEYAGNLLTTADPDHIEETLTPKLREGAANAGRDFDDVEITTEFHANYGDPDEIVSHLREQGEYVPESELDNPDPRDIQRVADEKLPEQRDEELMEAHNITDDPQVIIDELERHEEAGVDRVLVGSTVGDPWDTLEVFEAEIFPSFR